MDLSIFSIIAWRKFGFPTLPDVEQRFGYQRSATEIAAITVWAAGTPTTAYESQICAKDISQLLQQESKLVYSSIKFGDRS